MTCAAEVDFGPLRSLIETQFLAMSSGVQANTEIAIVVDQLIQVATCAVLDCAHSWSDQHTTIKLPDELLAACFACLPLRDRFSASQVSRTWRRAALSFPSVWSQVEILDRARGFAPLFSLALARTGCIPVDMECKLSGPWYLDEELPEIRKAVNRNCHHLRSLKWYMPGPLSEFLSIAGPAPLLESLETDDTLVLSPEFLGGKPSRLLTLRVGVLYLSVSCPSLATLIRLNCHLPVTLDAAWRRLFDLCPRLESLSLSGLSYLMLDFLPSGPAPRTLAKLELDAGGCDAAALYILWRTDRLTDVSIYSPWPAARLTAYYPTVVQLFAEAVHLDVSLYAGENEYGVVRLRPATPESVQCVITLRNGYDDHVDSFETLIRELSLDNLRSLSIDGVLLAVLLERPPRSLRNLELCLRRGTVHFGDERYPWKSPPAIQTALPELQTLCLQVDPPTRAGDGPQLLQVLLAVCATFPALTVDAHGVPQHIADELSCAEELHDRVVFHV